MEHIVGAYLEHKSRKILYDLARSENILARRKAIRSTFYCLKQGFLEETFLISRILLNDQHDLIHKAVGWILREMGKRCSEKILKEFLESHAAVMPRTMLRYAIEKLSLKERQYFMFMKEKK